MGERVTSREFLVKVQERSFKVWENLNGEQRIDDITRVIKKIPTVIFEADRENRFGHEGRSVRQEPFDPDDRHMIGFKDIKDAQQHMLANIWMHEFKQQSNIEDFTVFDREHIEYVAKMREPVDKIK